MSTVDSADSGVADTWIFQPCAGSSAPGGVSMTQPSAPLRVHPAGTSGANSAWPSCQYTGSSKNTESSRLYSSASGFMAAPFPASVGPLPGGSVGEVAQRSRRVARQVLGERLLRLLLVLRRDHVLDRTALGERLGADDEFVAQDRPHRAVVVLAVDEVVVP